MQCADQTILRGAEGQFDDRHGLPGAGEFFPVGEPGQAERAHRFRKIRRAVIRTVLHGGNFRQESTQCPHGRRFAGSLVSADKHTADGGVHGVQKKRRFHVFLSDDGGKRIDVRFKSFTVKYALPKDEPLKTPNSR